MRMLHITAIADNLKMMPTIYRFSLDFVINWR